MFSKTLLMALASVASGHIVLTNPVPYGSPDNSPLLADGSNFPCKGASPGGGGGQNVYEAGSTQQLSFQGGAVHGGGSCQVSVTTDTNPTKDSQWKVIKSIEGGCPARDSEGNIGGDAGAEVPYKYDFTIPEEMPEGEYVFAWTWFNKVGNREMYMNCASVQINGGGSDESFLNGLPDMFVANVGNGCETEHSKDVQFPDPGAAVEQLNGATQAFAPPLGECGATGAPGPAPTNEPAPEPTSPPQNPEPTPVPSPTSSPGSPVPTPTIPGGVFITVPTTAPTGAPEPEQPEQPEPEQPEEPTEPAPEPEVPSGGSGALEAGTPCATEGTWNCVGGSSFQRCASGAWSEVMGLAQGMTCDDGQSSQLKVHASAGKRAMRRSQRIRN